MCCFWGLAPDRVTACVASGLTPDRFTARVASGLALDRVTDCVASGLAPGRVTACVTSGLAPDRVTACVAGGLAPDRVTACVASGLAPHCLAILKTCHMLSEKLVGMTMQGNATELSSPETMTDLVATAKRISPRVDDVVRSLYPPLDPRLLEARYRLFTHFKALYVENIMFMRPGKLRLKHEKAFVKCTASKCPMHGAGLVND